MLVCLLSTSALLSSMVVGAMHETSVVQVSQEPPVVSLMRLNASAEISCSYSGLPKPEGLSLRQRFGGKEIMFMHIKSNKEIVQPHFDGRLTISADHGAGDRRCHFTIRLEQLQVTDTDGYYCHWKGLDELGNVQEEKSNYTLIIVRTRDPSEPCSSPSDPSDPLPRLFLGVSGLVFCLMLITFIGAVIWRCTLSTGRFEPERMRQTKPRHPPPPPPPHHHHHHPLPENRPLPLLPPPQTQLNHHHDDSLHHSSHHQADHHNHHHQSQSQSHHSTHNGHSHNGHQTQHPQTQHPQTYDEPPHHHDPQQSQHPHAHPPPHREDQFNHQNQRQQIYDHLPLHHRQSLPLPHHPPHPNHHHHPHRQTVNHHHHPHRQTVHHHPHHHPHHLDKQQLHSTISFPSPHHRSSQVNRH
ncbi:uncharacterized protein LOC134465739 [Engraulis encrasicolus]|uniref:uncharacterized protein LOC134465739 n=1 Tax=Engraulis encrasicolus TaxID=184585 RepID=UPI002FD0C142